MDNQPPAPPRPPAIAPLALALIAGAWGWFGGQQGKPFELALLPFWTYRVDTLSLLFASSFAGALALTPLSNKLFEPRNFAATLLLMLGLLQTAFAGQTWGRWAGLELFGLGLLLLGVPGSLFRHLSGYPLLLAASTGALDPTLTPGISPQTLPLWLVLLVLISAILRSGVLLLAANASANQILLRLFGLTSLYVTLQTLSAGPWDSWARNITLLIGMATLALIVQQALVGKGEQVTLAAASLTTALVLIALGIGSPTSVAGALAILLAAAPGLYLALIPHSRILRLLGAGALLGLPPLVGFGGLWLLLGDAMLGGYPLVVVATPLAALLSGLALVRQWRSLLAGIKFDVGGWLALAVLLICGLFAAPLLDTLLRAALNELAAGVPALGELRTLGGIGLSLGSVQTIAAIWPATALAVGLIIAFILASWLRPLLDSLFAVTQPAYPDQAQPDALLSTANHDD